MGSTRLTPGAAHTRQAAVQGRHSDQDAEPYATRFTCATHQVTYYVSRGDKQHCPVCSLEDQNTRFRAEISRLYNELQATTNQLERLRPQVDLQSAMKQALEVVDHDDLMWLKTQMYQYRLDKSVTLKVTHGRIAGNRTKPKGNLPPNGFMAMPRRGDPEAYACRSIGGIALAEYFDEAVHTVGSAQAMGLLLKAMWTVLPGATT